MRGQFLKRRGAGFFGNVAVGADCFRCRLAGEGSRFRRDFAARQFIPDLRQAHGGGEERFAQFGGRDVGPRGGYCESLVEQFALDFVCRVFRLAGVAEVVEEIFDQCHRFGRELFEQRCRHLSRELREKAMTRSWKRERVGGLPDQIGSLPCFEQPRLEAFARRRPPRRGKSAVPEEKKQRIDRRFRLGEASADRFVEVFGSRGFSAGSHAFFERLVERLGDHRGQTRFELVERHGSRIDFEPVDPEHAAISGMAVENPPDGWSDALAVQRGECGLKRHCTAFGTVEAHIEILFADGMSPSRCHKKSCIVSPESAKLDHWIHPSHQGMDVSGFGIIARACTTESENVQRS